MRLCSKIVAKGNVFAHRTYIEYVSSGRKIDMQLTSGTYAIDVEFFDNGPSCQAAVAQTFSHPGSCVSPKQQGEGGEVFTNEVADADEPQETEVAGQRHPSLVRDPQLLSQTEIDEHNMTHLPFRSWCRHCVRGRAEAHPHLQQKPKELVIPELHADYCFLGKVDEKTVPIMVLRDRATQMTCSMIVREKGIGDGYVVRRVIAFTRELGYDGKKLQEGPNLRNGRWQSNLLSVSESGTCYVPSTQWEKTGCLLTTDGTDDVLVKPEGIRRLCCAGAACGMAA